jgi:hypothetical protein
MRNLSGSSPIIGRTFCATGLYFFFIERKMSERCERSESLVEDGEEHEAEDLEEEFEEELEELEGEVATL